MKIIRGNIALKRISLIAMGTSNPVQILGDGFTGTGTQE